MRTNDALQTAARAKHDEFYTQISDIERELHQYRSYFSGKKVLCPCDELYTSSFVKHFAENFDAYNLAKLTVTCYSSVTPSCSVKTPEDFAVRRLHGNGDFRSPECIDLLKDSDIIVTNPPFSLFREFITLLMQYGKQFIIMCSINALTCRDIFPLFMQNRIWLGHSIHGGDVKFTVPDDYPLSALVCGLDEDGRKFIRVKGIRWLTNLDHGCRNRDIILSRSYDPELYPRYDNYHAIEVSRTKDIPRDYYGVMGVPITFLDKHNPEQFEILGITDKNSPFRKKNAPKTDRAYLNGKRLYARILIRRRRKSRKKAE